MKKSISFAIALIVVSTMLLSSCVKAPATPSITDSDSGINGSLNNTIPGESNDVSDNGTDNGTDNGSNNENNNNGTNNGDNSGNNSGDNSGNNSGDNSGNNSGNNSGDNSGNNPGDNSGNTPGDNTGNNPGDNTENNPGDNTGNNPGDNSGNTPGDNSGDNNEDTQTPSAEPTLNVNGTTVEWTLSEGIAQSFVTSSNAANTKFEMNIPVSAQGSYELGFDVNLGFTTTFTSGSKKATLSLPKTVFTESEPIPVAYSTSGLSTANNNGPWICVTKNVGGVDKYISYEYIKKNESGIVDITAMTGSRQDDSVLDYIWLDPGEYKIYLIDDSYYSLTNKDYWLHNDPINISIVPDGTEKTTVVRSSTAHGSASISVSNNIFCQGAPVKFNYTASGLATPNGKPWLCLSKNIVTSTGVFDYYTHWDYTLTDENSNRSFTASNGNSAQDQVTSYKSLPVGSYKIHYISGSNLQNCIEYVEPIGINIAPAASIGAKLGGTSIWSTSNPYDITSVKQAVTVTEADVAKGYITVEFDLSSLSADTLYYLNIQNVSMAQK